MAKPKDSTALFEVIAKTRPQGPRRWFDSLAKWLRPKGDRPSSVAGLGNLAMPPASKPAPLPLPVSGGPVVNGQRREIALRISYQSAAIAAVALVTLVGLAFLVGRKSVKETQPLFSTSTDALRQQPPAPDVTKLPKTPVEAMATTPTTPTAAGQPQVAQQQPPQPAGHVVRNRNRSVGLNYVIIQSYPSEKMANDAAKVLIENNIDCTVERKVPAKGFHEEWWKVVGTDGFARISSPEYAAYVKKIREISDNYAKKNKFGAFDPTALKWAQ